MCENCNYLCRLGHEVVVAECRTQKVRDVQFFLVIFVSGSLEISCCNVLARCLSISVPSLDVGWATPRSCRRVARSRGEIRGGLGTEEMKLRNMKLVTTYFSALSLFSIMYVVPMRSYEQVWDPTMGAISKPIQMPCLLWRTNVLTLPRWCPDDIPLAHTTRPAMLAERLKRLNAMWVWIVSSSIFTLFCSNFMFIKLKKMIETRCFVG